MRAETLETKQDEQARLFKKYRAAKRLQWDELCAEEPRLPALRLAIRRARHGATLLLNLADCWVRDASTDVRFAALQQIDRHSDKMARAEGREPLDDPLPPKTNVLLAAKALLAIR